MTSLKGTYKDDDGWSLVNNDFNFSTIGIGEVFASRCTSEMDNSVTGEIVGKLKCSPEDFIVREIQEHTGLIADLINQEIPVQDTNETKQELNSTNKIEAKEMNDEKTKEEKDAVASKELKDVIEEESAEKVVRYLLEHCLMDEKIDGTEIFQQIEAMYENAKQGLGKCDEQMKESVIIPPIVDICNVKLKGMDHSNRFGEHLNRVAFHQTLKLAFPLLMSCSLGVEDSIKEAEKNCELKTIDFSDKANRFLKVEVDPTFFDLVPYLLFPERDLPLLYMLRNEGIKDEDLITTTNQKKSGKKRKNRDERKTFDRNASDSTRKVKLVLKPTIERSERKSVHHCVTKCCRDLQTETQSDFLYDEINQYKTTCILVSWSRNAIHKARKRQKKGSSPTIYTSCVIKKVQHEHLSMINNLTSCLKCQQTDIGLAGIKDMQAITYQYCTLRDINVDRARKANDRLERYNIELGSFRTINKSLNIGDLKGNNFEIVVRDLKRVEKKVIEGKEYERFVDCNEQCISDRVAALKKNGFVNFFGEQRVGEAGQGESIGVRSYEIGRMMLKNDFTGAIDLLMKGRNRTKDGEFVESEEVRNVRNVYFTSNKDVDKTLSVLPSCMTNSREKIVLKGLKRYGLERPLEAIKCLNFSVRTFWINAYQSYVWNKAVTERIQRFGCCPIIGDLYKDRDTNEIKVVDDISTVSITDIVLPLVGYNIIYPSNGLGTFMQALLEKDGIEFKKDAVPEATAKGSYRHIIVNCDDLTWQRIEADGDSSDRVSSARFRFSLPKGSYATVCLRELMLNTISR